MKVSELMKKDVAVCYGGDKIQHAAEIMAKENKGLLPVFNNIEERKVIGVISNKDIIRKAVAKKFNLETTFVKDIMTKDVISVKSDSVTSDAMQQMRKYNIKRVLVIDNEHLNGIISSNDILHAMAQHKKKLLEMAIDF